MPWLILLRRFWWAVPMAVLAAYGAFWHVRADHALAARDEALATLQAAKVAAFDESLRQRRISTETQRAYQESSARAAAVAGELSRRLRDYAASSPVPAGPAPAGGTVAAPVVAARTTEFAGLVEAALVQCVNDVSRFQVLQEWARKITAKP